MKSTWSAASRTGHLVLTIGCLVAACACSNGFMAQPSESTASDRSTGSISETAASASPLVGTIEEGTNPGVDVAPGGPGVVAEGAAWTPQIGAGYDFNCALFSDRSLSCWGLNDSGQLHDGTYRDRWAPVPTVGLADVVTLAVGTSAVCVVQVDGTVLCWGKGSLSAWPVLSGPAVQAEPLSQIERLAVGCELACALTSERQVQCWSLERLSRRDNQSGQDLYYPAVPVVLADNAVDLAVGCRHACAIRVDGTVACWGSNYYGELGAGGIQASETPVDVIGISQATAIWTGAGGATYVRRADDEVWVWGYDPARSAQENVDHPRSTPVRMPEAVGATLAAVQRDIECLLFPGGEARCRRIGWYVQEGRDDRFQTMPFTWPVASLAVGTRHVCAMSGSGRVACLGNNQHGALGQGYSSEGVSRPTAVPGVDDALELAAGESFACARRESGRVSCWAARVPRRETAEVQVHDIPGLDRTTSLTSGGPYFCAGDDAGTTRCWGLATWLPCQFLSDDNCESEYWEVPAPVPGLAGLPGAVELSWNMVRMADGTIRSIEPASGGEREVVTLEGVTDAVQIAGDRPLRCARIGDGSVSCGCQVPYAPLSLARVPDLTGVVDIQASGSRLCAVLQSGQVRCNRFGEPGELCLPVAVLGGEIAPLAGVDDAVEVVSRPDFSCLRHRTGQVSCWGSGEGGGLGDGTTRDRALPVLVPGLPSVVELASSNRYVCARQEGGQVFCWGRILPGQEDLWSAAFEVSFD